MDVYSKVVSYRISSQIIKQCGWLAHGVFRNKIMRVTPLFPSLVELSCGKLTYVHGVSQNIPNPPCFPYMCTVALHSHSHAYLEWQPIILAVRWQNWIMILNPALKALFFFCKVIFVPNHSEWFCNYLERQWKFLNLEYWITSCSYTDLMQ